jgi:glucokinase
MTRLLAGDIGGTKTILRLVEAEPSNGPEANLTTLHENRYVSAEFPDLVPMVRQFFAEAEAALGEKPQPQKACFGIAGPVINNTSVLTNLAWTLAADRLEQELNIAHVTLINDFAAVGYGVLKLEDADLCCLQAGEPQPQAPIAIIGAGTGLGQGFLSWQGDRYAVYGTEGGHVDFAPQTELQFQLMKYLLEKHSIGRVSVERVVSGQGILAIYQFLRDREVAPEAPDVAQVVHAWERETGLKEKSVDPGATIAQAAAEGRDFLCQQTMQIFAAAYGSEAGNLALKILPYGGLYIAGGIAAKNLPLLQRDRDPGSFLKAFVEKGRMRPLMERVPIYVVLNPQVGLIGAAVCAARLPD